MLQRPTQSLKNGLFDDGAPIARTLTDKTVEDLDPSRQGDLFAPKKLFGIIPFGNRLRDYSNPIQIVENLYTNRIFRD